MFFRTFRIVDIKFIDRERVYEVGLPRLLLNLSHSSAIFYVHSHFTLRESGSNVIFVPRNPSVDDKHHIFQRVGALLLPTRTHCMIHW